MKGKKCFKCGKVKPLDEFYKHPQMGDGYLNKCKECAKKDVAEDRINNPEKLKARDKKRNGLPHRIKGRKRYAQSSRGKKVCGKAKKKWIERNPLKRLASLMVSRAIRVGRLKRQPCEECGSTTRVHGHHDDYYKPLEVRWLCPKCHTELHREMKDGDIL
jgi:ribosomal protein S27AE